MAVLLLGCPGPKPGSGAPDPSQSEVSVDRTDSVVADGSDRVKITLTVKDSQGNPVSGAQAQLTVSGSGNALSQPAVTDAKGTATATLASTVAETKSVTVTLSQGPISRTPSVTFVAGAVSPFASTVAANPNSVTADGVSTATITVTLRDANNNPVVGKGVVLGATGSQNVFVQPQATDARGAAVGTLASSRAELKSVMASVANVALPSQPLVQFVPGAAAKLAFQVPPGNAASGALLAPAVQVAIEDAQGNLIPGATSQVTVALGSKPAGAVLSGAHTVAAVSGVATFSDLSIDRAASGYTLVASAAGLTAATSDAFAITVGASSRLVFATGPSNGVAGQTLSPAIQVQLEDASGNPVTSSTALVTLALGSAGGATLSGTTSVAASGGVATFSNLSIDKAPAGYTLVATASGFAGATSNTFGIAVGPASKLVFTAQPGGATSGATLSAVQVTVEDAIGNPLTGDSRAITLALGSNPGGGTLSGSLTANAVNGIATFSNLSIDKAGSSYTLMASGSGVSSAVSGAFDVSPGAASKLAFTVQPSNGSSGGALNPAVRVAIQDAAGNLVSSASSAVTLALGNAPGATLSGTLTVGAVNGVASFANLSVDKAGSGYTLSATSGSLSLATSAPFNIAPGAASKLAFTLPPSSGSSGSALTPAVQVSIQDAAGNTVSGASNAITVSLGNAAGATLSGTATVGAASGIATFANLSVDKAGSGYTLSASAGGLTGATSSAFDIAPGAASKLAFTVPPTNGVSGSALSTVQVTIEDAAGNAVTGATSLVLLSLGANPPGGTLAGTTSVNAVSGVATFSSLRLDKAGNGYALQASSGTLPTVKSTSFNIAVGPASQLVLTAGATSGTAATALAPAFQVAIEDAQGNVVSSATSPVTVAFGNNPAGGTLSGTLTVNATGGVATFSDLSINRAGSGYTLAFSGAGLAGATSGTLSIAPGPAAGLVFSTSPANVTAGATLSAVQVGVVDAQGNTVTGSSASISLGLAANPAGGALQGTTTVSASGGVATFSALHLDKAGNGYSLSATASGLTGATSTTFNVSPGAASRLTFVVQPSAANNGVAISPPVKVDIQDSVGNTVPGATGSITVALGANPVGGTLSGTTTVAAVSGEATFSNLSIDKPGMGYTLVVSGPVSSATSAPFNISLISVSGTSVIRYLTDTGEVDVNDDLSTRSIGAYLSDGDGGFSWFPGVGTDAGTFTIANLPLQPYLLKFDTDYVATSARSLDMGYYAQGRPDVRHPDAGTYVHTVLTAMPPWQRDTFKNSDDLQMFSSNAGQFIDALQFYALDGGRPNPGDTTFDQVTDYSIASSIGFDVRLVNAASGDQSVFTHLSTHYIGAPDAGLAYQSLDQIYATSTLTVNDGQTASVFGALSPVPQNQSYNVNWLLAEATPGSFGSYRTAVNPNAINSFSYFFLDVTPTSAHGRLGAATPDLVLMNNLYGSQANISTTFTYGNPFPSSYAPYADAFTTFRVPYSLSQPDGGTSTTSAFARIVAEDLTSGLGNNPLKPVQGPVQNPTINGVNAFLNQSIPAAPTVSWGPPVTGTPTFYQVRIGQLYLDPFTGRAVKGPWVGRLLTESTSVQVPTGLLQSGNYYFLITAVYEPGHATQTAPYLGHFPRHSADVLTGLLTVP